MLGRVALVRTDILEEHIASVIRATRIGELGTTLAFLRSVLPLLDIANVSVAPILVTVMMEAIRSSERSVLTRAIRRNIPEDGIIHIHCPESHKFTWVKSLMFLTANEQIKPYLRLSCFCVHHLHRLAVIHPVSSFADADYK
jgi:hypothetical protein